MNNHRDHILRKLGLPSRTAAAAWYWEQVKRMAAWIGIFLSGALRVIEFSGL